MIDREQIKEVLPHRDPFLFLDEITEYEAGKSATAVWHIKPDLPVFQGHFPGRPILPGVLIAEALAQAGAFAVLMDERFKGRLLVFGGIEKMRFRGMVTPGDTLILNTEMTRLGSVGGKGKCFATVDGKTVCEGEIMFAIAPAQK